jgi:hypothetical protein
LQTDDCFMRHLLLLIQHFQRLKDSFRFADKNGSLREPFINLPLKSCQKLSDRGL